MNRNKLKTYAPQARRDFIEAVTARAALFGLTAKKIEPMTEQGDVVLIVGRAFPKAVGQKRKKLEARIQRQGFDQTMEAMAYTWFNRLVAIRFMELHGYLDHGYRVLSSAPSGNGQVANGAPEIVQHAEYVDLPGLDKQKVIELKLDGTKEEELYRLLLVAQCNALNKAMPFLFESIDDETELLVPDHLLHSDSLIRKLVEEIPEDDWQEVEIIGWLYQFYISERKDEVIGKVVKSEDIPAATQLFTPNWIVKYLVQNSLGRQWMATYPNSPLKGRMEYYIEPAEQTPEVQAKLAEITPKSLNPEELTLLDPACGSGHILVEAYDLLKAIYQERGYRAKDIPRLILEKNLFGLEIDDRAAQLAAFALTMKARADDRNIFSPRPLAGEGPGVRASVQPRVLSIQESKGLDAREITEAINQPILKEEPLPSGELFEEIADEKTPLFSRKNLAVKGAVSLADVTHLIELFEHGKTFGSLIRVPEALAGKLSTIAQRVEDVIAHGGMFEKATARSLTPLIEQARMLAAAYDAVVMNPPYMGSRGMNSVLKSYAKEHFSSIKPDLFACFTERAFPFTASTGIFAMVTMQSWMFLSSYHALRNSIIANNTVLTMAHLGPRAFSEISGEVVQTTAFAIAAIHIDAYRPVFFRLVDGCEETKRTQLLARQNTYTQCTQADFARIPGAPLAYWASPTLFDAFQCSTTIDDVAPPRIGMMTTDNERFLRRWYEVAYPRIGFGFRDTQETAKSGTKWFPYNKGGGFRKWFGNYDLIVNWQYGGREIAAAGMTSFRGKEFYFREGITWSDVSTDDFACRYTPMGFIFDIKGTSSFPSKCDQGLVACLLNSAVGAYILKLLNPTMSYQSGDIRRIPVVPALSDKRTHFNDVYSKLITLAQTDWNSFEVSWDFECDPLVGPSYQESGIADSYRSWRYECEASIRETRTIEEENNRILIDAYGLHDDMKVEVPLDKVSLLSNPAYRYSMNDDNGRADERLTADSCREFISYAIGCMMGRYSLEMPGLVYAQSGNQDFDPLKYRKFPADEDGIIPLMEFGWFTDDAANRFETFLATAWPAEHLEKNLKFVAEGLGTKNGESTRDTIRRYLAADFFKHHLSMYKKRPIYWLFSSGRQRGFQAIVYLHRYNEGTLARMRTEYVIPLLGKITARIKQLGDDITATSSTAHVKKLEKEKATLTKQLAEVQVFDEKLRHYADQRIELDLDDGVKVNYGMFGDLLAEVRAITGGSSDE